MKKIISTVLIIAMVFQGFTQGLVDISNTGKCEQALDLTRFTRFGPTTAPEKLVEGNKQNFDYSKHPTWYKFTVPQSGILLFDVIPVKNTDNYDFILYNADENFCANYKDAVPVRSNIQPPKYEQGGKTGLSVSAESSTYEKGFEVKKGEEFYLALNNVYENGKGHTVELRYLNIAEIAGVVKNKKNGHLLKAKVEWANKRNEDMKLTGKTSKKGQYKLHIPLSGRENYFPKYTLTAFAEKFIPEIKTYSTQDAKKLDNEIIDFELSKIKKGLNNDGLGIMYFLPNEDNMEPNSEVVFDKLLLLMKSNIKIEITLHGHTNGLYPSTNVDLELSEQRADAVKNSLIREGVAENRIRIEGYGSTKEVYPNPEDEEQEGFNRRVEVFFDRF
ncbi:MAG: OmpA family protein [Bacteroidota bacterium]|nr:OmpA family protein [Bacteroidota bacterium]